MSDLIKQSVLICAALALSAFAYAADQSEPRASSCLSAALPNPASDKLNAWGDNQTRSAMLGTIRQLAEQNGVNSFLALEIGLAGTHSIYNSVWLLETPLGIKALTVETPETPRKEPESTERALDAAAYDLLWKELEDLRLWDTPSDTKTVGLRADAPVFTATFCRAGRLHRVRIENPPLPTWGKDDSFEQARRRHDKKAREFLLRPRDRAIEVMRLIQAF